MPLTLLSLRTFFQLHKGTERLNWLIKYLSIKNLIITWSSKLRLFWTICWLNQVRTCLYIHWDKLFIIYSQSISNFIWIIIHVSQASKSFVFIHPDVEVVQTDPVTTYDHDTSRIADFCRQQKDRFFFSFPRTCCSSSSTKPAQTCI